MIGEIIGNDFEKFEKIKVLYKIAFRHLIMKINSEESTREIILGNDNWSFDQFLRLDFFKKQNTNKKSSSIYGLKNYTRHTLCLFVFCMNILIYQQTRIF